MEILLQGAQNFYINTESFSICLIGGGGGDDGVAAFSPNEIDFYKTRYIFVRTPLRCR